MEPTTNQTTTKGQEDLNKLEEGRAKTIKMKFKNIKGTWKKVTTEREDEVWTETERGRNRYRTTTPQQRAVSESEHTAYTHARETLIRQGLRRMKQGPYESLLMWRYRLEIKFRQLYAGHNELWIRNNKDLIEIFLFGMHDGHVAISTQRQLKLMPTANLQDVYQLALVQEEEWRNIRALDQEVIRRYCEGRQGRRKRPGAQESKETIEKKNKEGPEERGVGRNDNGTRGIGAQHNHYP